MNPLRRITWEHRRGTGTMSCSTPYAPTYRYLMPASHAGDHMFVISLFTVTLFLIARGILTLVQRYLDARGAGRSFKRMLKQGRIDAGIYADAIWTEASSFGRTKLRPKISRTQQRVIRDARRALREDFLNDYAPGFYQYIIIFLIASVLGLILETVYMYTMYGVLESRVGLVWGTVLPALRIRRRASHRCALAHPQRAHLEDLRHLRRSRRHARAARRLGHGDDHACMVLVVPAFPRSHHAVGCVALPHHVGRARTCMVQAHHARDALPHRRAHHAAPGNRGGAPHRVHRAGHRHHGAMLLPRRASDKRACRRETPSSTTSTTTSATSSSATPSRTSISTATSSPARNESKRDGFKTLRFATFEDRFCFGGRHRAAILIFEEYFQR